MKKVILLGILEHGLLNQEPNLNYFQGWKMNKPETGMTPEVKQALVSVSLLSVFILIMSSIFGGIFLFI